MEAPKALQNKALAVVGLGYVGLPLVLLAAKKGYKVHGIDIDAQRIEQVKQKISPFKDEIIAEDLKQIAFTATTDFSVIKECDIVVICVPTPVDENHMPDLSPVEGACRASAPYLKKGTLVILESTVNPGVSEGAVLPILEKESGLKAGVDFYLAHCPERINPGDTKWNVENIPRVVGALEPSGLEKAVAFYRSIITGEVKPMGSLKEAEAVKVVENSFRDINIAFVNELARSFSKLGIDVVNVIDGAATKPFAFMPHYPGCGVGGHCIPVDPYYLIDYAKKKNGFSHCFLSLACKTNEDMPKYTVQLVEEELQKLGKLLAGSKVAVLGLSYKADIDDCRESPSFEIVKELERVGAKVNTFDPHVKNRSSSTLLESAVDGVDAVVVATGHKEFRELKPGFFLDRGIRVVVDGRNCLPKAKYLESGVSYRGIGR